MRKWNLTKSASVLPNRGYYYCKEFEIQIGPNPHSGTTELSVYLQRYRPFYSWLYGYPTTRDLGLFYNISERINIFNRNKNYKLGWKKCYVL